MTCVNNLYHVFKHIIDSPNDTSLTKHNLIVGIH